MSIIGHVLPDNGIFAALEAVCCPPEELAQALGVDLRTLWSYYGDASHIPTFVLERLVELLYRRAEYLRDVAATLDAAAALREAPLAS